MTIKIPVKDSKSFLVSYSYLLLMINHVAVSEAELELLYEFLSLPESYRYKRFTSAAKRKVIASYKDKGKNMSIVNMNNKLYSLIKKGVLKRDEDSIIQIPSYVLKPFEEFIRNKKIVLTLEFYEGSKD